MTWSLLLALVAMLFYALRQQTLDASVLIVGVAFFVFAFVFGSLVRLFR